MTRIDLDHYVPFFFNAIGNRLSRGASRLYLQKYGIGIIEWRIMVSLALSPDITAGGISQLIAVDKGSVSRSFERLQGLGLSHAAGPRRQAKLRLTAKGLQLHNEIAEVALAREAYLLTGFSASEKYALLGFLRRLYKNSETLNSEDYGDG